MDTIKRDFKLFLLFVALFAFVHIMMRILSGGSPSVGVTYTTTFDSPELVIIEIEATATNVHIQSEITNTTGAFIQTMYLRFEFYNEYGRRIATEDVELRLFHNNETMRIDESYRIRNVSSVRISIVESDTNE